MAFSTTRTLPLLLVITSAAHGQTIAWQRDGSVGSTFGRSIANIGDVTGDGLDDIAVGSTGDSTGGPGAGRLVIYRADGTPYWEVFGDTFGVQVGLGQDLAGIGDISGDGVPDLLVTLGTASEVRALSGVDGSTLYTFTGGISLGSSLAGAGDVNGDGTPDFLIGEAYGLDPGGDDTGQVTMYSGATGDPLFTVYGDQGSTSGPFGIILPGDYFGTSIGAGRDLTGDGIPDFGVGAIQNDMGGSNAGQVKLFHGRTGQLISVHAGTAAGENYGRDLTLFGDVDGDGKSEVAVGAPYSDIAGSNSGRVEVLFSRGTALYIAVGTLAAGERFGTALAAADDLNGDGAPDFVVGAPRAGALHEGTVHLIDGLSGATLNRVSGILDSDGLGGDVAGGFDVTGDGVPEFAASAQDSNLPAVNAGYVQMVTSDGGGLGISYCNPAVANSTGIPSQISAAGSPMVSANDVTIHVANLPQNTFGFFLTSTTQGFITNPGGSQGTLCLSGAIGRYLGDVFNSGSVGRGSVALDLPNTPSPSGLTAIAPGETWNFQCWHRDANPNLTSNFSPAVSITFQ